MDAERRLSRAFLEAHPDDAAVILEALPADDAATLLAEHAPVTAATVLRRMAGPAAAECLARLPAAAAGKVLGAVPLAAAAALLRRLAPESRDGLLEAAGNDIAWPLRLLLRYPEGTAGAFMDPHVLALPHDVTVGEALARVRRAPRHVLYYLYVVDREQRLVGVVNLRELMLARPRELLASVMRTTVASLPAHAGREDIVAHPGWSGFHAMPVVDEAGAFLGAIRYETVRDLERDAGRPAQDPLGTVLSLGELCWIGLAGMLQDLASTVAPPPAEPPPRKEAEHGA